MKCATKAIDIEDERDSVREAVRDLESKRGMVEDNAQDHYPPQDKDDEEALEQMEAADSYIERMLLEQRGKLDALERAIEEWNGTELTIRELSGQEVRMMKDEVERKATRIGQQTPGEPGDGGEPYPEGMHEVEMVKKSVETTPAGAPEPGDIHTVPNRLFDWLHDTVNAFNSVGDIDMGNSSLRGRLAKASSEKRASETGSQRTQTSQET